MTTKQQILNYKPAYENRLLNSSEIVNILEQNGIFTTQMYVLKCLNTDGVNKISVEDKLKLLIDKGLV